MALARVDRALESERGVISALMTPYLIEIGHSGIYEYLSCYWLEPGSRFPYLIRIADSVAGFAFVRKTHVFEMAEFYVIPQYRRQRIGQSVVEQLLQMHPGEWTLAIAESNYVGQAFWAKALPSHVSEMSATSDIEEYHVIRFNT